jgi:hypothetical protein
MHAKKTIITNHASIVGFLFFKAQPYTVYESLFI